MALTRRALLGAGALVAATACTSEPVPTPPSKVDPDVALRAEAVARERALLAAYDTVAAASPATAGRLASLRAEHEAHLAALHPGTPASTAPSTPPSTHRTLAALRELERTSAAAHAAGAVAASRRLAPLLASLAGSEAAHVVAL